MKLIYIHIPKTAGSSISKVLQQGSRGEWLNDGELEKSEPRHIWNLDYISGHFTLKEILSWADKNQFSLENVKVLTAIRHPLEQLQSNLSFPFELSARGDSIDIPWMKDILLVNPNSADDLYSILKKYPWILNMQWQYLVNGAGARFKQSLDVLDVLDVIDHMLDVIDHMAIFPNVSNTIDYISQVLEIEEPGVSVHENVSRQKVVKREVFAQSPLRELILSEHSLDIQLFNEALCRQKTTKWLRGICAYRPFKVNPERFLESWIAEKPHPGR